MSHKSHHYKYVMQCMKENMNAQSITLKEMNHMLPLDHMLPLYLTYSLPLPLLASSTKT